MIKNKKKPNRNKYLDLNLQATSIPSMEKHEEFKIQRPEY